MTTRPWWGLGTALLLLLGGYGCGGGSSDGGLDPAVNQAIEEIDRAETTFRMLALGDGLAARWERIEEVLPEAATLVAQGTAATPLILPKFAVTPSFFQQDSQLTAYARVLAQIQDPEHPAYSDKIDRALREGLDDTDSLVRYEAAVGLLDRNHWDVIPVLLEGLEDERAGVRARCHQTLRLVTSQDFGFSLDAPPADREVAVQRWKSWYDDWRREQG